MSTAVMLHDAWKPTVIQLVPFSHSKTKTRHIRKQVSRTPSKVKDQKRNFPVLAVTRASSGDSQCRESTEGQSPIVIPQCRLSAHSSKSSTSRKGSAGDVENVKPVGKKEIRVKIVIGGDDSEDTHGESLKCSVQDLNEQATSDISSPRAEVKSSCSSEFQRTTKYLPKPTIGSSRYFLNHISNSNKGAVKLTPGEEELHRHKENYTREQAQKKKKYKLNVNQLPRSTTPIHDHDPDKLNMKQVIQFLQNQKSTDKTSKPQSKSSVRSSASGRTSEDDQRLLFERATLFDPRNVSRGSNNGSAMSVRSTPIIARSSKSPDSQASTIISTKSVIERPSGYKRSSKKSKEFKLHRFLAVAPPSNKEEHASEHVVFAPVNSPRKSDVGIKGNQKLNKTNNMFEELGPDVRFRSSAVWDSHGELEDSAKREVPVGAWTSSVQSPTRQKYNRTANVVHRKARRHHQKLELDNPNEKSTLDDSQIQEKRPSIIGTIRLPMMGDFSETCEQEQSDGDQEVASETLETSEPTEDSVETSVMDTSYQEQEMPHISVSIQPRMNVSLLQNVAFYPQQRRTPQVPHTLSDNNKHQTQRQLLINMPSENCSPETDVIKLSLRKERDVTADQSYMYDMVERSSDTYRPSSYSHYQDECLDKDSIHISTVSMQQRKVATEDDTNATNTMAKSCIKVRKKLKANIYNNNE